LLIQVGHGELVKITESGWLMVRHIGVKLVTTLLKLVGAIIAISMMGSTTGGLGRLIYISVLTADYPVVLEVAWIIVLIIVITKLVAELIEIAYKSLCRQPVSIEQTPEQEPRGKSIPRGWLIFSLALVLVLVVIGLIMPLFAPYPANEIHLMDRLQSPSAAHIMGTDQMGRDIYSQLLYSFRNEIRLGFICLGVMGVVTVGWAILAAYLKKVGNWKGDSLEDLVMLPRDIACAFPWPFLLILLMSILGSGDVMVAVVSGLVLLPHAVGMMRESYTSPPEGKNWLKSVLWSIPVVLILTMAGAIIYISTLSYIGFGVPPGTPELGNMLSSEGRKYMEAAPQLALWSGTALALLTFAWIMAGNTLLEYLGFRSRSVWLKVFE
jgi:peptide/nickel transport system permease protein